MKKHPGAGLVMTGLLILLGVILYAERWADSAAGICGAMALLGAAGILLRLGDRASVRG